jgi:hypothetical protein
MTDVRKAPPISQLNVSAATPTNLKSRRMAHLRGGKVGLAI